MKVEVDAADPAALAAEWASLADRAANPAPYRSAAWMRCWLPRAAAHCELFAVRGRLAGETVALAVFGLRRAGLVYGRTARLFECGEAALDDIYVEYNDALLTGAAPPDARRRLLGKLLSEMRASSIVLRNVVPPMRQGVLAAARDHGWVVRVVSENSCYGVALGAPLPVSRNMRQQLARSRRLYEAGGTLEVEVADGPASRATALPRLIELHEAVWQARGERGAFGAGLRAFHEDLCRREDAPVEIVTVRSGDRVVGMLYNLVSGTTVHNYQSGFVAEADNRMKPGLTCHVAAMDHYRARGFADYDMMAGESRYKQSLGFAHKRLSTIEIERPSLRQRLKDVARNMRR